MTRKSRRFVVAVCVFVFGFAIFARAQEKQAGKEADDPAQRSEWFRSQRAYPLDHVPAGARLGSLEQLGAKLAAEAETTGIQGPLTGVSWTLLGPEPTLTGFAYPTTSGRVTALAVDPTNSSVVYLGAAEGGIWKTTDGGTVWSPLTDNQASLATGSIAIAPSNHEIVYVGTGEEDFSTDSYYGAGVLISTNAGSTWTLVPGPFGASRMTIGSMAVHPTNPDIVLAGTNNGVYRSTNGGTTWTQVLSGGAASGVLFNPTNGNTAYAGLYLTTGSSKNGVYVSTNEGSTWTLDNGSGGAALPTTDMGRIAIAIAASSPSTLFAGIANSSTGGLLGLYKTTDGGSQWTLQSSIPDYCTPQCWYDNVVGVDPTNASVVYVGGSQDNGTLFRSLNGGSTWTNMTVGYNLVELHEDHHALAFSANGGILFVGNDGGVWSTPSPTATDFDWTNLNATLAITEFYPGASIATNDPDLAFAGTQDNGIQEYVGSTDWDYSWCGDGAWTAINSKVPTTVYASCWDYGVEESTLGGVLGTWNTASSGISTGDRRAFIPPLVMDPTNSQKLYFGTYRLYQTTNGASSWQAISSDLTGGSGDITVISVAPSADGTVYVGTSNGEVSRTSNAGTGATWTDVSTGLPNRSITQIAVSPTSSSTAYVTYSGFPSGAGGHIYQTTNSGATWTDVSLDLPNTPVDDLVIDPTYPSTLYAATDIGVFYTTNNGSTWTTLLTGLPNVAVLGLKMYEPTRTLWAATHGRSMWTVSVEAIQ